MMDEAEYSRAVADLYDAIMDALDAVDPDAIEGDVMGGRLDLTAANGDKCILTTQPGPRQVWVAGGGEGVHFVWDVGSSSWRDDKDPARELRAWVTELVRRISGERLAL